MAEPTDDGTQAVTLEAVKERFLEAEQALSDTLEAIQELQRAEKTVEDAGELLTSAGRDIGRYAAAAERYTNEMGALQQRFQEIVARAEEVLGGENANELRERLGAIEEKVEAGLKEQRSALDSGMENLVELIGSLGEKLNLLIDHRHGAFGRGPMKTGT